MKPPEGLEVKIARLFEDYRRQQVEVVVKVDWPRIIEGWKTAFEGIGVAMQKTVRALSNAGRALRDAANDEVRVSGLEARYYVRGGLACHDEADLAMLVWQLLNKPETTAPDERFGMTLLTPSSRARLAAAALRGYVEHHRDEDVLLSWHRLMHDGSIFVVTKEIS